MTKQERSFPSRDEFAEFLLDVYNTTFLEAFHAKEEDPPQTEYEFDVWTLRREDKNRVTFSLSSSIISEIVEQFFADRKRLLSENKKNIPDDVNQCKLAGYFCYWIAKLKPISINGVPAASEICANEYYALLTAIGILGMEYTVPRMPIPMRVVKDLIRLLRFGIYDADSLTIIAEVMTKSYNEK